MKVSTQVANLARTLQDALDRPELSFRVDVKQLHGALNRWATELVTLEKRIELLDAGRGDSDYATSLITNAHWLLSLETTPPLTRELAEAVLILTGTNSPS